ncbi:MAG: sigma-70 family RNA polymerase sigma factor [Ruminococcaceae bacterium]|nr:sigma-70 family RNA polymerase sigma factor [Oscillospiraceae bacterium]
MVENKVYQQALVFAAKNGNDKSFEELYRMYYQKIYALCLTTLKNADDAQDALQMTFIDAWQNINKLEDDSAFNTWVQRIAINRCYSFLRKKKINISLDDEDEPEGFEETDEEVLLPQLYAERSDLSVRLKKIIDNLSEVQRQTVMLYYFSELSVEEIAVVMDCSEGTVKSRLFLARKAIKTEIEEQERKSGEKFYGVAGIPVMPLAKIFVAQVKASVISESVAAAIIKGVVSEAAASAVNVATSVNAVTAASKGVQSATKIVGKGAANVAGKTAKTAAKAALPLSKRVIAVVSAAVISAGSSVGTVAYFEHKSKNQLPSSSVVSDTGKELHDTELSASQEEALTYFYEGYYWGFHDEYDSSDPEAYGEITENITGYKTSVINGIIGHPHGVNYDVYPVTAPRDMYDGETFDYSESYTKADELGIDIEGGWLIEFDKESVYWVAENIFNLDEKTVTSQIEERINDGDDNTLNDFYEGKGSDGKDKYYIVAGGVGGPGFTADITWVKTDGEKYYILYDLYGYGDLNLKNYNGEYSNNELGDSYYSVMELKNIDGREYWSIYKNTKEIPSDIFTEDAPDLFSQISDEYIYYAPMGRLKFKLSKDGSVSGMSYRSVYEEDEYITEYFEFTGKFINPKKVDKYTYSVEVSDIKNTKTNKYSSELDFAEKSRYDSDAELEEMKSGDTIYIYIEGSPVSRMPEECRTSIVADSIETETGLPFNCLYDANTGFGFKTIE